ncbi:Uncharacterised protein [Amycolatopsis camponoti]|uniref:Uncharacterized protein n=1 Tax=Amycolatopsis camponoti TaxID=2606593 RepID=A0A6I8LK10_9PSEU|nr:Uncharacterised protein [Amycolatopsis camponoti]
MSRAGTDLLFSGRFFRFRSVVVAYLAVAGELSIFVRVAEAS